MWVALNTWEVIRGEESEKKRSDTIQKLKSRLSFTCIELTTNLRNSRGIVRETMTLTSTVKGSVTPFSQKTLTMPPRNFPTGCPPEYFYSENSIEKAIEKMLRITTDGVLIIQYAGAEWLQRNLMKCEATQDWKSRTFKMYSKKNNDFATGGDPFDFLSKGNILAAGHELVNGFEWSNVIFITGEFAFRTIFCNTYLRCTTNLFIVKHDKLK